MDRAPNWDYSTVVHIPFGQLHSVHEWCEEHLPDPDWAIDIIDDLDEGQYKFFFRTEETYFKFLMWVK